MSKETKKNKKYTYDQRILEALVVKYGLTATYIRQCLSGNNTSLTSDKIKADYKELEKNVAATIAALHEKI
jgi:hypothetical protein